METHKRTGFTPFQFLENTPTSGMKALQPRNRRVDSKLSDPLEQENSWS